MDTIEYNGKSLLSVKNDLVFKRMFGKPDETLRAFLNDVLNLKIEKVEDITIENSEVFVSYIDYKKPRVDLLVKVNDAYVNVEIQCSNKKNFEARKTYYQSVMLTNCVGKGQDYRLLKKCISLWILDYKLPQCDVVYDYSEDRLHYSNKVLSPFTETHIIQLPLFKWENLQEDRDKWIGIFCIRDKIDVEKLMKEGTSMQETIDKLETVSADKKLRLQIQAEEDAEREYISYTNALKREALEEGHREGLEEGIEQGIEQGEQRALLQTAKNLKDLNTPIEIIAQATGLSIEEINDL